MTEATAKKHLKNCLKSDEWKTDIKSGTQYGIDIRATKKKRVWIIEVKGSVQSRTQNVNYFLAVLGEILQRMKRKNYKYSIALSNIKQYKNLWGKLPRVAKSRLHLSVLFISNNGEIVQLFR